MSRSRFTRSVAIAGAGITLVLSTALLTPGTASAGTGKCISVDGTTSCMVIDEPEVGEGLCLFGSLCGLFGSS